MLERPGGELLFWDRRGLGLIRLVSQLQFAELYGANKLGPDALIVSPELLRSRLASSHRPIKVALLDQRAIAGIGNLYASEILHLAGIHPARPCTQLHRTDWQRVYDGIREVLESAIRHEGSTLSDGTYRNALSQNGGYQNYHRVYDRAGERCRTCGVETIERIVQCSVRRFSAAVVSPTEVAQLCRLLATGDPWRRDPRQANSGFFNLHERKYCNPSAAGV